LTEIPQSIGKAYIKNMDFLGFFPFFPMVLSKCFWQMFWRKNLKIRIVSNFEEIHFLPKHCFPTKQG